MKVLVAHFCSICFICRSEKPSAVVRTACLSHLNSTVLYIFLAPHIWQDSSKCKTKLNSSLRSVFSETSTCCYTFVYSLRLLTALPFLFALKQPLSECQSSFQSRVQTNRWLNYFQWWAPICAHSGNSHISCWCVFTVYSVVLVAICCSWCTVHLATLRLWLQ